MLCVSCERSAVPPQENSEAVSFSIRTKAGSHETYRIMAYSRTEASDNYTFKTTGTYFCSSTETGNENAFLIPYTSTVGTQDKAGAIRGAWGDVWVSCISPVCDYNPDGSVELDPSAELFISEAEAETMDGFGGIHIDSKLKDTRSKFIFNFYAGEIDGVYPEFQISYDESSRIYVRGSGEEGTKVNYYPALKQITFTGESRGRLCTPTDAAEVEATKKPELGQYKYSYNVTVPAAYYAPKNMLPEELKSSSLVKDGNYLVLDFIMTQNSNTKSVSIPVTANMIRLEPMYKYVFNIIVKSTYITATIDIYDHSDEDPDEWHEITNEVNLTPIETRQAGTWNIVDQEGGEWQRPDLGEQVV